MHAQLDTSIIKQETSLKNQRLSQNINDVSLNILETSQYKHSFKDHERMYADYNSDTGSNVIPRNPSSVVYNDLQTLDA